MKNDTIAEIPMRTSPFQLEVGDMFELPSGVRHVVAEAAFGISLNRNGNQVFNVTTRCGHTFTFSREDGNCVTIIL